MDHLGMLIYLAVLIMTRGSSSLTVEIWNEIGWHVPLFRNQWQWREGIEKLKVLNLNISHGKKSKVTRNIYDGRRRTALVQLDLQCLPFLRASRLFVVCNLSSFIFLIIVDHNQCGLLSIWIRDIMSVISRKEQGKSTASLWLRLGCRIRIALSNIMQYRIFPQRINYVYTSRWWLQIFFYVHPYLQKDDPTLPMFKWVEVSNYSISCSFIFLMNQLLVESVFDLGSFSWLFYDQSIVSMVLFVNAFRLFLLRFFLGSESQKMQISKVLFLARWDRGSCELVWGR